MKLKIKTKKGIFRIKVKNGEDLLYSLDKFLKSRRIDLADLEAFGFEFTLQEGNTAKRISEIILRTIQFGVREFAGSNSGNFSLQK
jgi:hypothetical protein